MSDSVVLPVLSFLGWSFLPNIGTGAVQNIYYRIVIPAGRPSPQPGTHQYARDHRRIRILVLSLYLIYTLLQSLYDIRLAGDFFTALAVNPYSSSDKDIRTKFRRLAAKFHPDKIGSPGAGSQEEQFFVRLTLAAEVLTTPAHRYLYTHFGPSILSYLPRSENDGSGLDRSQSIANLIPMALKARAPSYLVNIGFVILLNTFLLRGGSKHGRFWRYLIIAASFTLEFYLLTHEITSLALPVALRTAASLVSRLTGLSNLLPPHLLPYQILQVSNSLAISLNIFISQISGLFPSVGLDMSGNTFNASQLNQYLSSLNNALDQIGQNMTRLDAEASSLLQLQFAPYRGQPQYVTSLRRGMKDGMASSAIRQHPEVQQALKNAIHKKRLQRNKAIRIQESATTIRGDGADVVDLLSSDEQFT